MGGRGPAETVAWTIRVDAAGATAGVGRGAAPRVSARSLHVHAWGTRARRPSSASTASRRGAGISPRSPRRSRGAHRVVAPDLLGHGDSPQEPPWRIDDHLGARRARRSARRRSGSVTRSAAASRSSTPLAIPGTSSGSCCSTPPSCSHLTSRSGPPRTRGGSACTRASRARSTGATRRASCTARRASSSRPSSGGTSSEERGRLALPVLAGVRRHRLQRDGDHSAAVRRRPRPDAPRPRRRLLPAVRPPPRRPSRGARRAARGRDRPRRAHGPVGRARRDRGGGRGLPRRSGA